MNIHKFLKKWVLPPNVYRSIGQVYFDYASKVSHPENIRFKNKYDGKRCFVIGTGPSLAKTHPEKIPADDITIVVNRFYLYSKTFHPTFCCMADRASNSTPESEKELFREIIRSTNPTEGFFLHESLWPIVGNTAKQIHSFKTSVAMDTLLDVKADWDFHSCVPGGSGVTITALTLALYLGCNPIYLIGTDCNWLTHRGTHMHCYEADKHEPELTDVTYSHLMKQSLRQFRSFEILKRYADERNVAIYNATPGSFLDVFPPVSFEEGVKRIKYS